MIPCQFHSYFFTDQSVDFNSCNRGYCWQMKSVGEEVYVLYSNWAKLRILYYKQWYPGFLTIIFWRILCYVCIVDCIYCSLWSKERIFHDYGVMCKMLDNYITIFEVNNLIRWEICEQIADFGWSSQFSTGEMLLWVARLSVSLSLYYYHHNSMNQINSFTDFPSKNCDEFLTCPTRVAFLNTPWRFTVCYFFQPPATVCLLAPRVPQVSSFCVRLMIETSFKPTKMNR
jgi:hypothetical protein